MLGETIKVADIKALAVRIPIHIKKLDADQIS
jgi:hypothetical protein